MKCEPVPRISIKMDKVNILCNKDKALLDEFSRRCMNRLKSNPLFKLTLSVFRSLMDANVQKEVEKDRLIIEYAATDFQKGTRREDVNLDAIFEKTKGIDRGFIEKVSILPLSIEINYATIKDIRQKRIGCIVRTVFDLLSRWEDSAPFADAIKKTYTETSFKEITKDILHLYTIETRMINRSIQFLPPINFVKEVFVENIISIMEEEKEEMANDLAKKFFRDEPCQDLT